MWGIANDSDEEPTGGLWGLFLPDGDVTWQNKALCSQTDPEAFFPETGGAPPAARRLAPHRNRWRCPTYAHPPCPPF